MFTEFSLEISTQQVERDMHDTFEVLNYLDDRSFFARDSSLHNFANVVLADTTVDADRARTQNNSVYGWATECI